MLLRFLILSFRNQKFVYIESLSQQQHFNQSQDRSSQPE